MHIYTDRGIFWRPRPAELRKEFQWFFRAMDFIASSFKEDGCGRKRKSIDKDFAVW
jgi:hypothetical protein